VKSNAQREFFKRSLKSKSESFSSLIFNNKETTLKIKRKEPKFHRSMKRMRIIKDMSIYKGNKIKTLLKSKINVKLCSK